MLLAIEERLTFDSLSLLLSFVLFSCVRCFPVTRMFGVSRRGGGQKFGIAERRVGEEGDRDRDRDRTH